MRKNFEGWTWLPLGSVAWVALGVEFLVWWVWQVDFFNLIAAAANATELIATEVLIVPMTIVILVRASTFHTIILMIIIAMIAMVIHM